MDNRRNFILAMALMLVIVVVPNFLWKKPTPVVPSSPTASDSISPPPTRPITPGAAAAPPVDSLALAPEDTITVTTPLARYRVSTRGGQLLGVELDKYHVVQKSGTTDQPVNLVRPEGPLLGLTLLLGRDTVQLTRCNFTPSTRALDVTGAATPLTLKGDCSGFAVELTYTFLSDDYQVGVRGRISGLDAGGAQLVLALGDGIPNTEADSVDNFRSVAVVTKNTDAERHDLAGLTPGQPQVYSGPFEWVAVKSKYFVAAVLAFDSTGGRLSGVDATAPADAGKRPSRARVRGYMPVNSTGDFAYTLYAGPMEYHRLSRIGHDFDDVNPYGWPGFRTLIRFFAVPVRWLLVWMHESLGLGYGLVLIAFGILVRLVLWPLNQKAMRSATAMQAVQPQLQAIQAKHKGDPQRLQQEMMKLYKEHNVNPLGGCWPMLLPMPVLFALFFVLGNTIELRGVPFLWFPDLARADPLYIIPVLSGISMFGLSKIGQMGIEHTPQTEIQAKMMLYFMPVMITFFGLQFASGLNLYWTVSNLASLPQQWMIGQERLKRKGAPPKSPEKKKVEKASKK